MAFSSLNSTLINVGKPIIKSIFQTLKDNQDDLNTRLSAVESAASKIVFFNGTVTSAGSYAAVTGLIFHRVTAGIDLTDAKIAIFDKGGISSGTLEIDIQKASSPDFTSSVSVFTTKPSLDLSVASNYTESSNMVLSVSNKVLTEGDYLRFDISSLPSGLSKFQLYLIGEPS